MMAAIDVISVNDMTERATIHSFSLWMRAFAAVRRRRASSVM